MHATDVISTLQARGVTLQADGGNIRIKGVSKLTDREKATLKAHKSAILKALEPPPIHPQATPPATPVVAATRAVTEPLPVNRRCGDCVHFGPSPYEPPLGGCSTHERIQHANSQPTRFGCGDFELQPQEGAC